MNCLHLAILAKKITGINECIQSISNIDTVFIYNVSGIKLNIENPKVHVIRGVLGTIDKMWNNFMEYICEWLKVFQPK